MSGNQSAGQNCLVMSTQRYVSLTSSPTVARSKVPCLWTFKAEMYWGLNAHRATSNIYFIPFFNLYVCPPSLLSLLPLCEEKYKYRHLKSSRLYEKSHGLSYWNEVQQQLLRPLKDLMQNWLFHIRGPCSLCSHRAGMLDSGTTTKATIYQLWLHTFWSIAPLNC